MIALGTPVVYHHRAAVARYTKRVYEGQERYWCLREGANPKAMRIDLGMIYETDMFEKWPMQGREQNPINKTIMVWPEEGSGVVTGLVRRMKGISQSGYGYRDDYEPGYFEAKEGFDLYVIRHELKGQAYILVPMWAVQPMQLTEAK